MNKPLVSVYCLAYNHEKYIRQTLEGFVSQKTSFDYEVYVHDDASIDNTASIIKEYAKKYPNIIHPIYQKENQYSKGISIIQTILAPNFQGKYIAICEGDDCWCDNNKLQIQVDFLESHPDYSACVHNTVRQNLKNGKTTKMYSNKKDRDINILELIENRGMLFHTSSLMYRREYLYNRPNFFKYAGSIGDYPQALYLAYHGKIRFISKVMSIYRLYTENSWTVKLYSKPEQIVKVYKDNNRMLHHFNSYTNQMFEKQINKSILQNEYLSNEILHYYDELKKDKYKNIWNNYPIFFRIKRQIKKLLKK